MSEARPSGSMSPWLVGLILIVAIAPLVMAFVPMVKCPECEIFWRTIYSGGPIPERFPFWCRTCNNNPKTTLLRKWTYRPVQEKIR